MAYDSKVPPNPEMLREYRRHIWVNLEHQREVVQSQYLEKANQTEENAHKEKDSCSVEPRTDLHYASNSVAQVNIAQEGNLGGPWAIPPYLVSALSQKTGDNEDGQDFQWSLHE